MISFEDLEAVCYTTRGVTALEDGQGPRQDREHRGAVPRDGTLQGEGIAKWALANRRPLGSGVLAATRVPFSKENVRTA